MGANDGLGNHFPNTMFGGVLLWTIVDVLRRSMRSLYALWRQKTPLTNGQVQGAKSHCRKIGEAWLKSVLEVNPMGPLDSGPWLSGAPNIS